MQSHLSRNCLSSGISGPDDGVLTVEAVPESFRGDELEHVVSAGSMQQIAAELLLEQHTSP